MPEINPRLWWEEITGPSRMIRAVVSELQEGKSVFLSVPDDLPWRKQMRSSVEHLLRENNVNLIVDYLDCQTDCPDGSDIAGFLLSRYARPEVQNGYRRSSGQSIQQYILNQQVLKGRIIWVKGMAPAHVRGWLEYCRAYQPKSADEGLFVMECHEDSSRRRTAAGMKLLLYKDYVRYHDALLFNNIFAAPMQRSLEWKQYFSTAAAQLCGCDVELSCLLLKRLAGASVQDPVQILRELSQIPQYDMRFRADFLDPRHPFALIRGGRMEELSRGLWKAQLQTLFPLIEYERIEFIQRFQEAVREGLDEPYLDSRNPGPHYIKQLNERIYEPYDAEIGTLYRMNTLRRYNDDSRYLLFLSEEGDRERLRLLRDMRNAIAHTGACSPETVSEFLSRYPYPWQSG